jgi:hypothetical protein
VSGLRFNFESLKRRIALCDLEEKDVPHLEKGDFSLFHPVIERPFADAVAALDHPSAN